MRPDYYRYFLAFRPEERIAQRLIAIAAAMGIASAAMLQELFHLTLFVMKEAPDRQMDLPLTIDTALSGAMLPSCRVKLGRAQGGKEGAALHALGRQAELNALYETLVERLAALGLSPLYRKNGLHAHVTLSYQAVADQRQRFPMEWIPHEVLLIESWVGCRHHEVLARWPLKPPVQGELFAFN